MKGDRSHMLSVLIWLFLFYYFILYSILDANQEPMDESNQPL